MRIQQLPPVSTDFIPFNGGLDLVSTTWNAKSGALRASQNYEIAINGGYERILGYERFDGRPSPSSKTYFTVNYYFSFNLLSAGDTIVGQNTGATAKVLAVTESTIPGVLPNTAVLARITGKFEAGGEPVEVDSVFVGSIDGDPKPDGASTDLLHAQYKNLTADEYRSDIGAVPGSGNVLGVWMLNDIKYAFRNNSTGSAAKLYKSSAVGWTEVPLGRELPFTSGSNEILEGQIIVGDTSGANAVITRVVLESGSWSAGDAAGRVIFTSQSGVFQSENLNIGASLNVATIAGNSNEITLLPNGRYEFVNRNFGGQDGAYRAYGCDGVNRGFEFDGEVFVPIVTGMAEDAPTHVFVHKLQLFFSFKGSAQHSGPGTPYIWSPIFGAGELSVGDTITGFQAETGQEGAAALGIYSKNSIHILYGSSSLDWDLVKYRDQVGARAHSLQQVGTTIMLDDRGITTLTTTQAFGNFQHATLSQIIQPWIKERRSKIKASCISRDKSQYRLFFTDKHALFVTFDGKKIKGLMPVLFEHRVECIFSLEDNTGQEIIMFGSDDGYVYQLERGTSFDGENIEHYLFFHFHHSKSPRVEKKYKSVAFEVQGNGYASFDFRYELGYNAEDIPQPTSETKTLNLESVRWDDFYWDSFYYDGRVVSPSRASLDGSAENISLIIRGSSDYDETVKFTGALLRFIPRRQVR